MVWKTLCHPNILSLIGVVMADTHFGMASEWMADGNINQFVKAHRSADRLGLVGTFLSFRVSLCLVTDVVLLL